MAKKRTWPNNIWDFCAFLFVVTAAILIFLYEIFVVIPYVHVDKTWLYYLHYVCGTFVVSNILGNLFGIMVTDTTSGSVILPSVLQPNWRFCPGCEANSPPRSFHCNICRTCVLKRDHHCIFSGCCIGYKNQRFFIGFLFYMMVGCLYATVLNMFFIWDMLGGFNPFSIFAHVLPFIFWVTGYLELSNSFATLFSMLCITGFGFVASLLAFHVQLLLRNQTTFEKNHGITEYNLGWKDNLIQTLGERWYMVWSFPLLKSPLPGDGITFMKKEELNLWSTKNR